MNIKILCDKENLMAQGLPESEAARLAGAVVEATQPEPHAYFRVPGTDKFGQSKTWLFGEYEVKVVKSAPTQPLMAKIIQLAVMPETKYCPDKLVALTEDGRVFERANVGGEDDREWVEIETKDFNKRIGQPI